MYIRTHICVSSILAHYLNNYMSASLVVALAEATHEGEERACERD